MAQATWTFEATTTAQLQAIHDGLVAFLGGGAISSGVQSYVITQRSVTRFSIRDAADLLSCVSNELARRKLHNRDELIDVAFNDGPSGCPPFGRPPGY